MRSRSRALSTVAAGGVLAVLLAFGLLRATGGRGHLDDGALGIGADELRETVAALTTEEMGGRRAGLSDEPAAALIEAAFERAGLAPAFGESFRQPVAVPHGRKGSWNIGGVVPGADPELAREVIVVGAHFDHLGRNGERVFFGADDNASGVAALIELAEAASLVRSHLKRTVVFVAFTGEESGLHGSRAYVLAPSRPLEATIAMLNLDMVGSLGRGPLYANAALASAGLDRIVARVAGRRERVLLEPSAAAGRPSDHHPFLRARVASVCFHTRPTDRYHTPRDTAEHVDFAGLNEITHFVFDVAWTLANARRRPSLDDVEGLRLDPDPSDSAVQDRDLAADAG